MIQLLALVLLIAIAAPGYADATLSFRIYSNAGSTPLSYYIKDGKLRFNDENSNRINIYERSSQTFTSVDREQQTISRIDRGIIAERSEMLNKQRLEKLKAVEADLNRKLDTMTPEEQEAAASVLNSMKYPEFYGAHTFLNVRPLASEKTVSDMACKIYELRRQEELLKTICMANATTLGLSDSDYRTLRDFFRFNYHAQTQMMIASGRTEFTFIDYEQENMPGIAIEINELGRDKKMRPVLQIERISTEKLDSKLFNIQIPKK